MNQIIHASPKVRKFARQLGADISKLKGSERNNRITEEDVRNFIKNQIKLSSNPSSSKNFDVNILSKYDKIIIAKDSAGVATDYKINISLNIVILSKNNIKINYNDSINIKNNSENFEQIEYEREIKKNFASDVKDKLILYLISLDDS